MNLPTQIRLKKVPRWLVPFVAWRLGADGLVLALTPSSMELTLEKSRSWRAVRCILHLWPGSVEEKSFTLVDLQFHARQWSLQKWLESALSSEAYSKMMDSRSTRTTLR